MPGFKINKAFHTTLTLQLATNFNKKLKSTPINKIIKSLDYIVVIFFDELSFVRKFWLVNSATVALSQCVRSFIFSMWHHFSAFFLASKTISYPKKKNLQRLRR